jgi:hypothetical protein
MTINNNTIHALLTKGTEMSHIMDITPKPKEVVQDAQQETSKD